MFIKSLLVNGVRRQVLVNAEDSLANVLRDQLQLTSVKLGCEKGHCGACSVILNGKLTRTCVLKMKRVPDDATIITLEGIGTPDHLHPLQEAWIFHGAAQCGFCTPGFIV
uniref:(2Fe-2S)-binding protein n=1 Tax=uncultured Mailhella sp. TaxID=1981031 RepID=UPI0025F58AB1